MVSCSQAVSATCCIIPKVRFTAFAAFSLPLNLAGASAHSVFKLVYAEPLVKATSKILRINKESPDGLWEKAPTRNKKVRSDVSVFRISKFNQKDHRPQPSDDGPLSLLNFGSWSMVFFLSLSKIRQFMQTKAEIVKDWLPRYTGTTLNQFGNYILLCNFRNYIDMFAEKHNVPIIGLDKPMQTATAEDITIINFGMGSAMAATIMDLLSAIEPKAVLLLGKCGGLKKTKLGDLILPIAAIRGEGTSNDYLPPEIPALPSFRLQRAVSSTIKKHELDYWTGTVYTTTRRVWEHDDKFKEYLRDIRTMAIDMETA